MKNYISTAVLLAITMNMMACNTKKDVMEDVNASPAHTGIITRTLDIKDFDRIDCSGCVTIYFSQGEKYSVKEEIKGKETNLISQHDNTLQIKNHKDNARNNNNSRTTLYITAPRLAYITNRGVMIFTASNLNLDNFTMENSGVLNFYFTSLYCNNMSKTNSGVEKISGKVKAQTMEIKNSGSDKDRLDIEANTLNIGNSGEGKFSINYNGTTAEIRNSGTGALNINVNCKHLNASNSGVSNFQISGTADDTKINNAGVSSIDTSKLNKY